MEKLTNLQKRVNKEMPILMKLMTKADAEQLIKFLENRIKTNEEKTDGELYKNVNKFLKLSLEYAKNNIPTK